MANTGLGEAIGLQGKPDNYFFALGQLGQQEKARKAAQEAAKKKKDDEDFNKMLEDIKFDPNKYHYKDRDRALRLGAETYKKAQEAYVKYGDNFRNKIEPMIYEARFLEAQIQQDSKDKYAVQAILDNPEIAKSQTVLDYGAWLNDGKFDTKPPQLDIIPGGQAVNYNPDTGVLRLKPVKNMNLNKFAQESIFKPAEIGEITTLESVQNPISLPTGEKVYQQKMQYKPDVVEANIAGSVGSGAFEYWVATNEGKLREALKANSDREPAELYYELYSQDIKARQPSQIKEYREEEAKANVTNIYNDEAKNATLFTDLSNVWQQAKTGDMDYTDVAAQTEGTVVKDGVKYRLPEKAVGKPQVVSGRNVWLYNDKNNSYTKTKTSGTVVGVPEYMTVGYGVVKTDGTVDSYTNDEYKKLSPEKKKAAKQLMFVHYSTISPDKVKEIPAENLKGVVNVGDPGAVSFREVFSLEPGSRDLNELNSRYPDAIGNYGKTMKATLKDPREDQTREKKTKPDEGGSAKKMSYTEWVASTGKKDMGEYANYLKGK